MSNKYLVKGGKEERRKRGEKTYLLLLCLRVKGEEAEEQGYGNTPRMGAFAIPYNSPMRWYLIRPFYRCRKLRYREVK